MTLHPWLHFGHEEEVKKILDFLRDVTSRVLNRRGAIVAISGGIDSSVCAALATTALGKEKIYSLILPEKESSASSRTLAESLCSHLGISYEIMDISTALEAIGCYRLRDDAIRSIFDEYGDGWKSKIVISQGMLESDRLNYFKLVVESPDGIQQEKRLPLKSYLQIVAANNFKQRIRKTVEYFHADRLNYCVLGTPNRLEYDQGFFVKNGDGAADVKPIAHLYKSQVYELGRYLGLPDIICSSPPTTDTYSLSQSQDEFFFVLPYEKFDLVLFGLNNGKTAEEVGMETGLSAIQVTRVFRDIMRKRMTTRYLHQNPILIEKVLK